MKTCIKKKSKTRSESVDPQNPILGTNFNFLCAVDQKL